MIFVVEDDESIRNLIVYALNEKGYETKSFDNGSQVISKIKILKPELIILDIMLPHKDGFQILNEIKENDDIKDTAVIILTARDSEYDKLKGLDNGADDYIVKPFSVLELLSRIKAVLRRTKINITSNKISEDIQIDTKKREVLIDGCLIDLTYKEFEMLNLFLNNPGKVITREEFLVKVWGYDYEGETRTVDVHIASLRNKLRSKSKFIKTVRNLGYKFDESKK